MDYRAGISKRHDKGEQGYVDGVGENGTGRLEVATEWGGSKVGDNLASASPGQGNVPSSDATSNAFQETNIGREQGIIVVLRERWQW